VEIDRYLLLSETSITLPIRFPLLRYGILIKVKIEINMFTASICDPTIKIIKNCSIFHYPFDKQYIEKSTQTSVHFIITNTLCYTIPFDYIYIHLLCNTNLLIKKPFRVTLFYKDWNLSIM